VSDPGNGTAEPGGSHEDAVAATERWFLDRGLPFFVEDRAIDVNELTRGRSMLLLALVYFGSLLVAVPGDVDWPERLLSAAVGLVLLSAVWAVANLVRRQRALGRPQKVGITEVAVFALGPAAVVALFRQDADMVLATLLVDLTVLGVVAAAEVLDLVPIARWALLRTLRELGSLFPLVTRALPMLLLFATFLFINTEVWQVASALSAPVLWLAVAFFGTFAVLFLLARLPEEVDDIGDELPDDLVEKAVRGTPVAGVVAGRGPLPLAPLSRKQRVNLLLVLLVTQLSQVLILAVSVWAFFLVFGRVAISESVITSWVGEGAPRQPPPLDWLGLSTELVQVSIFLAAFSGLYFTVYAVTDATYREQFFTAITDELERAIGVRAAYLDLLRSGAGRTGP
jgi:hypothetical protein